MVVMSVARRRKRDVCLSAAMGVLGRTEAMKLRIQVVVGWTCLPARYFVSSVAMPFAMLAIKCVVSSRWSCSVHESTSVSLVERWLLQRVA